ncbi:hypothetical protein, partial [Hyphomonas adhaerens]|uniref:hypothetical protein n=1 Tax=Hyphomonas adhaerens TaxID=81029 RepID=UPI002357C04C
LQAGAQQSVTSHPFSIVPSMASQPPAKAESVTHVSGTICHPCLEPLISENQSLVRPVFAAYASSSVQSAKYLSRRVQA